MLESTARNSEVSAQTVSLLVPGFLVKTVKLALEAQGKYDRSQSIKLASGSAIHYDPVNAFVVPTTLPWIIFGPECRESGTETALAQLLQNVGLKACATKITLVRPSTPDKLKGNAVIARSSDLDKCSSTNSSVLGNLLARTIRNWLEALPSETLSLLEAHTQGEKTWSIKSNQTYMIYPPMLLLPPKFFSAWPPVFLSSAFPKHAPALYSILCKTFHVTHIALNGPIPADVPSPQTLLQSPEHGDTVQSESNILRSPTNLTPLHGSFGPLLPMTSHQPLMSDFEQAFWCTARQNSIYQTWAPRYTMFSRGNISEKARILQLDSLTEERLGCRLCETSAVDLYAGIGYFAFSYAKAGVGKVLCWEINPWSIEGLVRGAKGNGWRINNINDREHSAREEQWDGEIVVFAESNEHAARRIVEGRERIPPIRHVNCGFLPSSRDSWRTAVEVLDPIRGGRIHAHENIAVKDIESRKMEIVQIFEMLFLEVHGQATKSEWTVFGEHVERVKSYAPGVMHCVLDIAIEPTRRPPESLSL